MPWCVMHENLDGIRLLLHHGARLIRRMAPLPFRWDFDEDFGGVSHLARSLEMANFLLCAGADVNEMSDLGRTPLHVAVENGDLAMAALLLANGANVQANGHGNLSPAFFHSIPLQSALNRDCHDTKLSMVKLLLEYGGTLPTRGWGVLLTLPSLPHANCKLPL